MRLLCFLFVIHILKWHLWQICHHKRTSHIAILHLHKINLHLFRILTHTKVCCLCPHHRCISMSINNWRTSMQHTSTAIHRCLFHQPIKQCCLLRILFIQIFRMPLHTNHLISRHFNSFNYTIWCKTHSSTRWRNLPQRLMMKRIYFNHLLTHHLRNQRPRCQFHRMSHLTTRLISL